MNNLKLGKLPATYDQRTLQLQTILKMRELPPIPKIFDCDTALPAPIPLLLFGNNKWGDCVIAAPHFLKTGWTRRWVSPRLRP